MGARSNTSRRRWLLLLGGCSIWAALAVAAPARANDDRPRGALVSQQITVRKGDTLGGIADKNGVKVEDLRRWNRGRIGKGDVIRAGAVLIVKVPAERADPLLVPDAGKPSKTGSAAKGASSGGRPTGTWEDSVRVRRGDTLSRIAARVGVPLDDLMAWNHLRPKSKLKIGQRLIVYRPGMRPAPQSVGRPTGGTLAYGLHLGEGTGYRLRFPKNAYAVDGVLKTLRSCTRRVHDAFPGTHDLLIGDLSRPEGGHFAPHESHQSGRDADVGYYLSSNEQNDTLHRVQAGDVEYARTWALMRCFITTDAVTRMYMDRRIQVGMVEWLRKKKTVDEGELQRLFEVEGGEDALVKHAREHDTHFHVRFACDHGQLECVEEEAEEPFDF